MEPTEIEIVKFVVRVPGAGRSYLVGIDQHGNEYEWDSTVHMHGENHDVDTWITRTDFDK